jgi:hypothetical protein
MACALIFVLQVFHDQNWVVPASWRQRENGRGREEGELTRGLGDGGGDAGDDTEAQRFCSVISDADKFLSECKVEDERMQGRGQYRRGQARRRVFPASSWKGKEGVD